MSSLESQLALYQTSATNCRGQGVVGAAQQQPVDGLSAAFSVSYWPFTLLLITDAGSLPICVNSKRARSSFVASSRSGYTELSKMLVPTLHGSRFINKLL